jgi:hypothetical protein
LLLGIGQVLQDVLELRTFAHTQTFFAAEETLSTRKNCQYMKIMYSGRERLNKVPSEVLRQRVLSVYLSLNPFGRHTVEFQCIVVVDERYILSERGILRIIHNKKK